MNHHADVSLPDEIETLETMAEAAAVLKGELRSVNGGWQLRLPGAAALAVSATDSAAFPLALGSSYQRIALPACTDAAEMAEALRVAVSPQESRLATDLTIHKVVGWQPVSAEADRIELVRTDQSARGWPATAEVTLASGTAIVETRQVISSGDAVVLAAADHLLASASQRLVQMCRKPGHDGASRLTSASTAALDSPEQVVCYRLATPAVMLTPARLADALAMVGAHYRDLAPALDALAEHPVLSEAYLTLHRRSK